MIAAGDYAGGLTIDDKNLTLEGQNDGVWNLTSGEPAITVKGTSQAIIRDFSLPADSRKGLRVHEDSGANATFEDCTVNARNDGDHGGGLKVENSTTATVRNCTFSNNDIGTQKDGGAILVKGSASLTVENSTFTGNKGRDGGAIRVEDTATASISGSTFTNNSADTEGGAIHNASTAASSLVITDSTFNGDFANTSGGAIYLSLIHI